MAGQRRSMAVLFADVSDSTRIYEVLGDTAAFGSVRHVIDLLRDMAAAFEGRVVKTIGDGALCVFPTADSAAEAAREMQLAISRRPGEGKAKLMIRIGFHFGSVIEEGTDVFGDSVNLAARMCGLALPAQVITTAETVGTLSPHLRETTRRISALPVKGKVLEVDVHELIWQTTSERTVIPGRAPAPRLKAEGPTITLSHHGKETVLKAAVTFGRDAGNAFVIADPMASRQHAKIDLRTGKFVLVDQSSNGTFVTLGGAEMRLHREETVLHGAGVIAFGHSASQAGAETVEFRCDAAPAAGNTTQ